ncbi:hypothetical protein D5S17_19400 [Pseudonocardiaceae bacterium YIM PH 21723]|nr:hypothetical protein D5S17_19400 [Pseudonocardiaceae bacterium YIM PH 21723]
MHWYDYVMHFSGVVLALSLLLPVPVADARLELQVHRTGEKLPMTVTLRCGKAMQSATDHGSHPNARQACADLGRLAGDPTRLAPATPCRGEPDRVMAVLSGTWNNSLITFSSCYASDSALHEVTGEIFDFSD